MQKYVTVGGGARHARLRLLGYYVQRGVTSRRIRGLAARLAVAVLGWRHGRAHGVHAYAAPALAALRATGFAPLGQLLSARACAEALDWLREREMIAARGDGSVFRRDAAPPGAAIGDFPLDTVVHCPHILALANHPDMLALAAGYLGYTPTITLMGLRWSFPGAAADNVQAFHRDAEPGSIKMLVYLTDVGADAGPHHYVAGSHRERMPLRLRRYADAEVARDYGAGIVVTGPAGTAFAIDTKGIHKGTPPARVARLLLVVQYSLLPCLQYDYAPVPWRGMRRFDRYANRLMIVQPPAPTAA
jgi:hypothetical protein